MSWQARELDVLLTRDFDDVVHRAESLKGRERTAALRDVLERLQKSSEPSQRVKALLLIQTLLAAIADGKLASTVADVAAHELSHIVMSALETADVKRPALDSLALLFIKAKELTTTADTNVRTAFAVAQTFEDSQVREFAARALAPNGVLSKRVMTRQYRFVNVSVKTAAGLSAAAGAGYAVFKLARKKSQSGKAKASNTSNAASSRSERTAS